MTSTKNPQSSKNIYPQKPKGAINEHLPYRSRQDKGALTIARLSVSQPAAVNKVTRALGENNTGVRLQNHNNQETRLVKATFWLEPRVKREIQRRAEDKGLSFSSVGAMICREWVEQDIFKQNTGLLELKQRQIIREELRAFGDRLVFFLMHIAFASEQSRILITNVLGRVLKLIGAPQESFHKMVDDSARLARRNIIKKTPQLKSLIEEWKASLEEENKNKSN